MNIKRWKFHAAVIARYLKENGYHGLTLEYMSGGDSGQIESLSIDGYPPDENVMLPGIGARDVLSPDGKRLVREGSEIKPCSIPELAKNLWESILMVTGNESFGDGDGGRGTLTVTCDGEVGLEHYDFFTTDDLVLDQTEDESQLDQAGLEAVRKYIADNDLAGITLTVTRTDGGDNYSLHSNPGHKDLFNEKFHFGGVDHNLLVFVSTLLDPILESEEVYEAYRDENGYMMVKITPDEIDLSCTIWAEMENENSWSDTVDGFFEEPSNAQGQGLVRHGNILFQKKLSPSEDVMHAPIAYLDAVEGEWYRFGADMQPQKASEAEALEFGQHKEKAEYIPVAPIVRSAFGHPEKIADYLAEADKHGTTRLIALTSNRGFEKQADLVRQAVEAGLSLEGENDLGMRAIHMATLWNNLPAVRLLAEMGADIEAQTHSGKTPQAIAEENKYTNLVNLFDQVRLERALAVAAAPAASTTKRRMGF
jgi:hypothetical protein